jgi:hypothetical protein
MLRTLAVSRQERMMNANEARRYARVAGVLVAISLVAGGFGESFVPDKLFGGGDFHEAGLRVAASLGLFRAGFLSYTIEAACDLSLTAIFYLLLRPVSRPLALITAFFGMFGTATFAVGEIFYYVAALPQIDAHFAASLSPDARAGFAYLCLKIYATVFNIFAGFYGAETMLRRYLFFRSGYLSRVLGALLLLAGAGFIIKNLCAVLAPQYNSGLLVLPMMVAMLGMAIWLPLKGLDRDRWEQLQALDQGAN